MSFGRSRIEKQHVELRWRHYKDNPADFFADCLMIPVPPRVDPRGRTELRLWPYQYADLQAMIDERFLIVLKARQIGLSTLVGALMLHSALFQPGFVGLWVSDTQENANKALHMMDTMWRFLPSWVKGRAPQEVSSQAGRKEWRWADGSSSRVRAFPATAKAGASETATRVVLDEFALADQQDDLLKSAEPTTDAGGQLIIISTARGSANTFAERYQAAERGESIYKPIFHPWFVSRWMNSRADLMDGCEACGGRGLVEKGGRDEFCGECVDTTKYEQRRREFSSKPWKFAAEYPTTPQEAFRESGRPRFSRLPSDQHEDLDRDWVHGDIVAGDDDSLRFEVDESGMAPLRVRADVAARGLESWRDYLLHVDPSRGMGGDYIAGQLVAWTEDGVLDRVAWWHANTIEAPDAAVELARVGRWARGPQGPAMFAVEIAGGYGDSMIQQLRYERYPRIYVHQDRNRRRGERSRLGLPMTQQVRPRIIDRLAGWVQVNEDGEVPMRGLDPLLLQELRTFVVDDAGRAAADHGCHDDLVMSMAGAAWIAEERLRATEPPSGEVETQREVDEAALSVRPMLEAAERQRRRREDWWRQQMDRANRRRRSEARRRDRRMTRR